MLDQPSPASRWAVQFWRRPSRGRVARLSRRCWHAARGAGAAAHRAAGRREIGIALVAGRPRIQLPCRAAHRRGDARTRGRQLLRARSPTPDPLFSAVARVVSHSLALGQSVTMGYLATFVGWRWSYTVILKPRTRRIVVIVCARAQPPLLAGRRSPRCHVQRSFFSDHLPGRRRTSGRSPLQANDTRAPWVPMLPSAREAFAAADAFYKLLLTASRCSLRDACRLFLPGSRDHALTRLPQFSGFRSCATTAIARPANLRYSISILSALCRADDRPLLPLPRAVSPRALRGGRVGVSSRLAAATSFRALRHSSGRAGGGAARGEASFALRTTTKAPRARRFPGRSCGEFRYTQCPDFCHDHARDVLGDEKLGPTRAGAGALVRDPKRDKPSCCANTSAFDPSVLGCMAMRRRHRSITRDFKIYCRTPGKRPTRTPRHAAQTFAYDRQGKLRLVMGYGMAPDAIASDLRILLNS